MTLAVIGIKVTMTVRITESEFKTFYPILFSDGDDDDDDDDDDDEYAGTVWCQECWWYSIPHDEWSAAPPMWKSRYGAVAVDLSGPSNNSKSGSGLRTV